METPVRNWTPPLLLFIARKLKKKYESHEDRRDASAAVVAYRTGISAQRDKLQYKKLAPNGVGTIPFYE